MPLDWLYGSLFGVTLTLLCYGLALLLNKKLSSPLVNPLLVASVLCVGILLALRIPYAAYEAGGSVVSLFLGPATCALAVNIHRQWRWLRRAWLPVLGGCAAGSLFSVASVYLFCRLLQLEDSLTFSLLPKAVTTPIAMELASLTGGVPAIAVAAVLLSGLLGSILAQPLQKALRLEDPVALGVALGTASHAIGTTKALELGEVQGAFSGMAIGISGLFTSLWLALFF